MVFAIAGGDNCGLTNNTSVLRVKELHITSAILAAKSPFFYKVMKLIKTNHIIYIFVLCLRQLSLIYAFFTAIL